ncbi:FMN-binding negative transcriptional regulator [Cohnella terricola]|uniref:FMN-binding negative transcriptional regulator n=1 Tax=Cohnella terricola TaxID=1289167 RepID=A0A559JGX4_9BACL|nr:FMN-binding negative transcriptional regulator [Cohnella terricola]TVX99111.1 FMN-binding negative transcriptional regulator [Cohnella terricola]
MIILYIPQAYQMKDQNTLLEFIKQNSFGVLISKLDKITATHLPFLVKTIGEDIYLYSHMAKANPQWMGLEGEVLVVFSGPQRYISPSWYAEPKVPTWNYLAAHLYGEFQLVSDDAETSEILSNTVDYYESEFTEPWTLDKVDVKYVSQLTKHIVGFKIRVTHWEAAWKLHQDYSIEIQKGVINALLHQNDDHSKKIAELMKKNLAH